MNLGGVFDSVTSTINSTGQFFDENLGTIGGVVNQYKAMSAGEASNVRPTTVVSTTSEKRALEEANRMPVWGWVVVGVLGVVTLGGLLFGKK